MYDNIILLLHGTEICGMIEVWFSDNCVGKIFIVFTKYCRYSIS